MDMATLGQPDQTNSIPTQVAGPWTRLFARIFDVYVLTTVIYLLLLNRLPALFYDFSLSLERHNITAFVLSLVSIPLALMCEAVIYGKIKTTPGKYLLGIRVQKTAAEPLSMSDYMFRNAYVWYYGLSGGIPILNMFSMYAEFRALKKTGSTSYDRKSFIVLCTEGQLAKKCIFGVLFIPVMLAYLMVMSLPLPLHAHMLSNSQPPVYTYVWTNKDTGRDAFINKQWNKTESTDNNVTTTVFSSQLESAVIYMVREPTNIDIKDFADALTAESAEIRGEYRKTSSGKDFWLATGKKYKDSKYSFMIAAIKISGVMWREVLVYPTDSIESASTDAIKMSLAGTILD